MEIEQKVPFIIENLKQMYPQAICALEHRDAYQLLIAARLSAQCTDARVNIVTQTLFERYKSVQDFADADIDELMEIVRPCGVYRVKARNIKDMSRMLIERHDGLVPDTMESLLELPGVGRKIANLILGDVYNMPAIVADTHLIRLSNLMGLVDSKNPLKVELALKQIIPPDEQNDFCHRCVLHGRALCIARRPQCGLCALSPACDHAHSA